MICHQICLPQNNHFAPPKWSMIPILEGVLVVRRAPTQLAVHSVTEWLVGCATSSINLTHSVTLKRTAYARGVYAHFNPK